MINELQNFTNDEIREFLDNLFLSKNPDEKEEIGKIEKLTGVNLLDQTQFLSSLRIGLRPVNGEGITRTSELEGCEFFIFATAEGNDFRCTLPNPRLLMEHHNISEGSAWEKASQNMEAEIIVDELKSTLMGLGIPPELLPPESKDAPRMLVVSCQSYARGAGALYCRNKLRELIPPGEYILLPSSIHEFLLLKVSDVEEGMEYFSGMVREVNKTIEETDILSDRAYRITI